MNDNFGAYRVLQVCLNSHFFPRVHALFCYWSLYSTTLLAYASRNSEIVCLNWMCKYAFTSCTASRCMCTYCWREGKGHKSKYTKYSRKARLWFCDRHHHRAASFILIWMRFFLSVRQVNVPFSSQKGKEKQSGKQQLAANHNYYMLFLAWARIHQARTKAADKSISNCEKIKWVIAFYHSLDSSAFPGQHIV